MDGCAREAGKFRFGERTCIANCTVDHEAGCSSRFSDCGHDFADQGAIDLPISIDDNYVTGTDELDSLVDQQVVASSHANGQGRPRHRTVYFVKWPKANRSGQSVQIVTDDSGRTFAESTKRPPHLPALHLEVLCSRSLVTPMR